MPHDERHHAAPTVLDRLRRFAAAVRRIDARYVEVQERLTLLNRPWEEELLHWAFDGADWQLHGHLVPPIDGRVRSVTRTGWCPGLRGQRSARAWSED